MVFLALLVIYQQRSEIRLLYLTTENFQDPSHCLSVAGFLLNS